MLDTLVRAGADIYCKVQPPVARDGRFNKDAFTIDLRAGTVTGAAGQSAALRPDGDWRIARFGPACATCPLAGACTTAEAGRSIRVGPHEEPLTRARPRLEGRLHRHPTQVRMQDRPPDAPPARRTTGPGPGRLRSAADFALLAAGVNLAHLAVLGLDLRAEPGSRPRAEQLEGGPNRPHRSVRPKQDQAGPTRIRRSSSVQPVGP